MQLMWATGRRRQRGFTLVELLVVVAVILVLISLLFPALESAQDRTQAVACLSNERQVGLAILQYVGDYRGAFPPRYRAGPTWADYLVNRSYLPAAHRNLLNCPKQSSRGYKNFTNSYGFSDWLEWSGNGCCPVYLLDLPILAAPYHLVPVLGESNNYRINYQNQPSFVIVPRHNDMASMFWIDGHGSYKTLAEMLANPIRSYWGQRVWCGCIVSSCAGHLCGPNDPP